MGDTVNLVDLDGVSRAVPADEAQYRLDRGWKPETAEDVAARTTESAKEDLYGGAVGAVRAGAGGVLRGATLGLSDVALRAAGGEDATRAARELQERHRAASIGGEILGAVATAGTSLPGGLAQRAGAGIAKSAEGASTLAQIGRSAAGSAVEGAIFGAGQGVSDLALSEDPVTVERTLSGIGSSALFGGITGGLIGGAGRAVERGLVRAKSALDDVASRTFGNADEAADLAKLDPKGLRAAQKAEVEAIEAARVPQRAEVAKELQAFRAELKQSKLWLATKGADDAELRAIGKRTLKADRSLDNILDDPKALAENPKAALSQLRKQEAALDELVTKHSDNLRTKFASDTTGERLKALDDIPAALERNRTLQARIGELSGKASSPRLDAIAERLAGPAQTAGAGLMGAAGDAAMGYGLGAVAGVPILGGLVAATRVAAPLLKKLGASQAELAARGSKAIGAFLDVSRKVAPAAPVLATKVLSGVTYAAPKQKKDVQPSKATLASSFTERAEEIRSQVQPMPDGSLQMRPSARAQMSERLAGVRAVQPVLADRMETIAARRLEYLASKLPRRPEVAGMQIGPDKWQPSDMAMRSFARTVAAVEDPHGVVERLASGAVTPEDAEAMKEVYPELYADVQRQIVEALPTLQKTLPYSRRIAMSIFSGVPVDPSMDPRILGVLQGSFSTEDVSEGGPPGPVATPQFGSVQSIDKPTKAQERAG